MSRAGALRMAGAGDRANRDRDDYYPTPPAATAALLRVERFAAVWECACGDGRMARELEAGGCRVVATDLVDRGYGQGRIDFLMERRLLAADIVTNPPFKLGAQFARHGLNLGAGKMALLLRLGFLEGSGRGDVLDRLARVWVFRGRLTFSRRGEIADPKGGMIAYAWFVWDRAHVGPATVGWIEAKLASVGVSDRPSGRLDGGGTVSVPPGPLAWGW